MMEEIEETTDRYINQVRKKKLFEPGNNYFVFRPLVG